MDCQGFAEMHDCGRTKLELKEEIVDDVLKESDREMLVRNDESNKESNEEIIFKGEDLHHACEEWNKKVNEFWITINKEKKLTWMKLVEETLYISSCYCKKIGIEKDKNKGAVKIENPTMYSRRARVQRGPYNNKKKSEKLDKNRYYINNLKERIALYIPAHDFHN
ncbi:hypothetical protein C2G38_2027034 [Gigaspora rosea]|uniref:Uncharacterized protein n=1 Tax=Gigaspora rosea TaxID=44941 RepID=A0A397W660_9GLOM|nr:hypothetical protein C2G38_2027034 [Gigaspora rosea]